MAYERNEFKIEISSGIVVSLAVFSSHFPSQHLHCWSGAAEPMFVNHVFVSNAVESNLAAQTG